MPTRIMICERCGRKAGFGRNKPHSQHRTPRVFGANIQKVRFDGQTRWLCTRCIQVATVVRRRKPAGTRS